MRVNGNGQLTRNEQMAIRLERLRQLLGEDGYKIFNPSKVLHKKVPDFIAAKKSAPASCLLVYAGQDDHIELRTFEDIKVHKERLEEYLKSNRRSFESIRPFRVGRPLPRGKQQYSWRQYVSPTDREELELFFRFAYGPQR